MEEYRYVKIYDDIWQIQEEDGVFCTLLKGKEKAILWDTGYGNWNLRAFVEKNVETPYIVINSHGHPDHCLGNHWFDTVYAQKTEWDMIQYFTREERKEPINFQLKEISAGMEMDLGGMTAKVVDLEGHTKGSIGLLIPERRLLLAGDGMNNELWLFNEGSLKMNQLYEMLGRTYKLEFDTFIGGHSSIPYKKSLILAHRKNIENLVVDEKTKASIFGIETYSSVYEGEEGKSKIVFSLDRI